MSDPSAAASGEAAATTAEEDKTRRAMFVVVYFCLPFALLIGIMVWDATMRPAAASRTPVFSITVSDVVGGLDPERSPLIHPALDLTLRVDNPMDYKMCWENATVTVSSYGDTVLGLGHLFQQLCVDKGASAEVKAALSQVHVMLPDDQRRGLMASKLRTGELKLLVQLRMTASKLRTGELKLLVQLRMTRVPDGWWYCHTCARDIVLHYCRVSPGHGFSPCNCLAFEIAQMHQNF